MTRLALLVLLGGCGLPADIAGPTDPTIPVAFDDTCGGTQYLGLVGQPEAVLERARIDAELRFVRPSSALDSDFRLGRLNVLIGADGRITELRCG